MRNVPIHLVLAALAGAAAAQDSGNDPEIVLWQRVQEVRKVIDAPAVVPLSFGQLEGKREELLKLLHTYQTMYPGGAYHAEAATMELGTVFELGVLRGGEFQELREAAARHVAHTGSRTIVAEAAHWLLHLHSFEPTLPSNGSATRPADSSTTQLRDEAEFLRACREYLAEHPGSPHAVRLAQRVVAKAGRDGDRDTMAMVSAAVSASAPDHPWGQALAAEMRSHAAVGQPVRIEAKLANGEQIDTAGHAGRIVAIVFWASDEPDSVDLLREVDSTRTTYPDLVMIGVNLDYGREPMARTCRELKIDWPQFNDGLGPANRVARQWGVARGPVLLLIDRQGTLVGRYTDAAWKAALARLPRR